MHTRSNIARLLSLLLIATLLLGMGSVAQAQEITIPEQGVKLQIPDTFTVTEDIEADTASVLMMTVQGDETVAYIISFGEDAAYAGKSMESLTPEENEALFTSYSADVDTPTYAMETLSGVHWMAMRAGNGAEVIYLTLLYGYLCEVTALRVDGDALTDEQIAPLPEIAGSLALEMPTALES